MSAGTWILLRGLTRETGHWGAFLPLLAARLAPAAVIAVDLPGAGARWREPAPLTITATTDALRRHVQPLARPWRLLGLSMGGMVATDWAARHPQDLAGVVLVNSSMRGFGVVARRLQPSAWPALLGAWAARDRLAAEIAILHLTSSRPRDHAALPAEWAALWQRHPIGRGQALRQLLAAARFQAPSVRPGQPMRILCSARDAVVDPRCSHVLAAAWSVPLAEHPTAGHDLPLDAPEWVADEAARLAGAAA